MEFWKTNMPDGMYLRSDLDWHLDPDNQATLDHFIAENCLSPAELSPLPLQRYLEYVEWFMHRKRIDPRQDYISRIDYYPGRSPAFRLSLQNGNLVEADSVAIAPGFKDFKNLPSELAALFPYERLAHTCDSVDLKNYRDQRVMIVGGRQSAFEWAALLHENGAGEVHVTYRHETPAFSESDWSWMTTLLEFMEVNPGWYRSLSPQAQEAIGRRFLSEARMKLAPWLFPRVNQPDVFLHPYTTVRACHFSRSGELSVALSDGTQVSVDRVILATGYRVEIARLPYLAAGNLLKYLEIRDGYPVLDDHFQTTVPGLYITSLPAVQDFGSFFAFTVSVRTSARLIGAAVIKAQPPPGTLSGGGALGGRLTGPGGAAAHSGGLHLAAQ